MSSKPPLLLLHGALGSSRHFDTLGNLLSEKFEVHVYDFPGHGGKPFAEHSLTLPLLAEHLYDHIAAFHLLGCRVFGYSMGGYAALWLETVKPGCFESIMTLGTKFSWREEIAEKEAKLLHPDFLEKKSPGFVNALKERHAPNDWRKLCTEIMHLMHHLGHHPLTVDQLGNISCKVRLTVGDRDAMVTLEETAHTYTALPNASMLVMPETPHPIEKVSASYLAQEITNFNSYYGV